MNVFYIIGGLLLLVLGGEYLVRSSVALSLRLEIPKMVIGMTVVSFATSAPELLVSLQAALDGSPAIAINNVIGSNIANIGLVLGLTTIITSIHVSRDFFKFDWPGMILFSLLFYYFLLNDGVLVRNEGIILFALLVIFLIVLIRRAKPDEVNEEVDDDLAEVSYGKIFFWLLVGGLGLYFGSEFLVDGAKNLAIQMGVSEAVISVTIIAVGTSVPELAASLISAIKGEKAISLGNLIGSNIFNIGSVLGLTSIIKKIPVTDASILSRDIFWMLAFAFVLLPLILLPKKFRIGRYKGLLLFLGYVVFVYFAFV